MYDFFISHASVDKADIVDNLVMALKENGCTVWYDKTEINEGDSLNNAIEVGLKESFCLVLIVTEAFINSKWCHIEISKFSSIQKKRIIPIIFNISRDSYTHLLQITGNLKYINAKERSIEDVTQILAAMVTVIKKDNQDLVAIEQLQLLQKRLSSYENISSSIISLKLKDYFEMLDNHEDYFVFSSQKIVESALYDLLQFMGVYKENKAIENHELVKTLSANNLASYNLIEYIQFVFRSNINTSKSNLKLLINQALVNILNWYINIRYPFKLKSSYIDIIHPENLTYKDFIAMYELDKLVMREDLIAPVETTYDWYQYNNYTHIAIRDREMQKLIGYFSMLPITQDTYNCIISGDFKDNKFTTDSILQYIFPDFYRLYVAGVAIHPNYQNTQAFIILYNALVDLLLVLAEERNIYISEIIAEASTKQGEKLCKMVGMKKRTSTISGTDVYTLVLIPPEFRLYNNKGKTLMKICQQKYEEYREYFDVGC